MIAVASLQASDIAELTAAFAALGWGSKDRGLFEHYFREQMERVRAVVIARWDGVFAGYVTVVWHSTYLPFSEAGVPEISDLNVLPPFRRLGIASRLMDESERLIAERSPIAGIGVGLHADYGPAQKLYVQRGYVPDARGLTSHGEPVCHGDNVEVNDDLILWFTRTLS